MSLLVWVDGAAWWCAAPIFWSVFDMNEARESWDLRDLLSPLWAVPMLVGLLWLIVRRWPGAPEPVNESGGGSR